MNHEEAKKLMAAEAYVLDDLAETERAAFEEHYFDCTDCTADVLDAATIADGVRSRSTTSNVIPIRHYQSRWAVAAAGAAVAIGLAYTYVPQIATELPQLVARWRHTAAPISDTPRVAVAVQYIELDMPRGVGRPYEIRADAPVAVDFVIPELNPQPPYFCELRDDAGRVIGRKEVQKKEAGEPLTIPVAARKFHSGKYTLAIRTGERELRPYHFAVEVH